MSEICSIACRAELPSSLLLQLSDPAQGCQAFSNWRAYVRTYENWMELLLCALTCAYAAVLFSDVDLAAHLGAGAVFIAWIELTLLLGRFPAIGIYIYMSFHVREVPTGLLNSQA